MTVDRQLHVLLSGCVKAKLNTSNTISVEENIKKSVKWSVGGIGVVHMSFTLVTNVHLRLLQFFD